MLCNKFRVEPDPGALLGWRLPVEMPPVSASPCRIFYRLVFVSRQSGLLDPELRQAVEQHMPGDPEILGCAGLVPAVLGQGADDDLPLDFN